MEKINWEIDYKHMLENDPDERMKTFVASGIGEETGNEYSGTAYFFCGELEEIKDIQVENETKI